MDFEKKDFAVGLFVLAAVAVFAANVILVNHSRLTAKTYPVAIRLPDISGINKGVEVIYRGYSAASVDRITIAYEPDVHFDVTLAVKEEINLKNGTKVAVRNKGFGGAKYLEFIAPEGDTQGHVLAGDRLPVEADADLMAKANAILVNVQRLVQKAHTVGTGKDVQDTVRHARSVVVNLDKSLENLNGLLAENRTAMKQAVQNTERAASGFDTLVRDTDKSLKNTLDNLNKILIHVPAIVINLEELTAELKRNPWRLIRKGNPKEAVPPLDHDHDK